MSLALFVNKTTPEKVASTLCLEFLSFYSFLNVIRLLFPLLHWSLTEVTNNIVLLNTMVSSVSSPFLILLIIRICIIDHFLHRYQFLQLASGNHSLFILFLSTIIFTFFSCLQHLGAMAAQCLGPCSFLFLVPISVISLINLK